MQLQITTTAAACPALGECVDGTVEKDSTGCCDICVMGPQALSNKIIFFS